jgi:hypothetical protein
MRTGQYFSTGQQVTTARTDVVWRSGSGRLNVLTEIAHSLGGGSAKAWWRVHGLVGSNRPVAHSTSGGA